MTKISSMIRWVVLGAQLAFVIVLWFVSVLAHGWVSWIALALAIPMTLWAFGFVFHRYGTAWRRIYFGLSDYHASMVGAHLAIADMTEGRMACDPLKPLFAVIKKSSTDMTDSQAETCLKQWKTEFDAEVKELFGNSNGFLHEVYKELHPSADEFEVTTELVRARAEMRKKENYDTYLLRYVIGQVVEKNAGSGQKKKYWKAVLTGKVD